MDVHPLCARLALRRLSSQVVHQSRLRCVRAWLQFHRQPKVAELNHDVAFLEEIDAPEVLHARPIQKSESDLTCNCDGTFRERTGMHGPFWGCSNYPGCRNTKQWGASASVAAQ